LLLALSLINKVKLPSLNVPVAVTHSDALTLLRSSSVRVRRHDLEVELPIDFHREPQCQ